MGYTALESIKTLSFATITNVLAQPLNSYEFQKLLKASLCDTLFLMNSIQLIDS